MTRLAQQPTQVEVNQVQAVINANEGRAILVDTVADLPDADEAEGRIYQVRDTTVTAAERTRISIGGSWVFLPGTPAIPDAHPTVADFASLPAANTVPLEVYTTTAGPPHIWVSDGAAWRALDRDIDPGDIPVAVANFAALPAVGGVTGQLRYATAAAFGCHLFLSDGSRWRPLDVTEQLAQAELSANTATAAGAIPFNTAGRADGDQISYSTIAFQWTLQPGWVYELKAMINLIFGGTASGSVDFQWHETVTGAVGKLVNVSKGNFSGESLEKSVAGPNAEIAVGRTDTARIVELRAQGLTGVASTLQAVGCVASAEAKHPYLENAA